jgi:transglutaminase-like putative cysteine protease
MIADRRRFLHGAAATSLAAALPLWSQPARAQAAPDARRPFQPVPSDWRSFELTTRVDIQQAQGQTQVWLPVPAIESDWQRSQSHHFSTNGEARLNGSSVQGVRMLQVRFSPGETAPYVALSSRVQTRNRVTDWSRPGAPAEDPAALRAWIQPTRLLPTDGIVRSTALMAIQGARTDVEKAQAIFDWVVANTWREPKTRGCGEGDIKTLLETGNLGGKCADLNALFVGLCRAVGLPARDIYGIRLAPSAFGYKELGGNPASLQGAQHCRAEVHLSGHGWVPMDPADVAKVMRQETPQWIKTTEHPVVASVNRALFGSWEGNWLGWNMAHDLRLPQAEGPALGFFMYPMAETGGERLDPYAPDSFQYRITATETPA